ncbi:membrane protein insertase YidC [bacterium]|nr:membrane protein insertase YidC [bacterium]
MDQRRALVAVVLIFAVLFGYNYWAGHRGGPRADLENGGELTAAVAGSEAVESGTVVERGGRETRVAGDETRRAASDLDADSAGSEAEIEDLPRPDERIIVVDAPLWIAELSTRGGDIVSWTLKEYMAADSTGVNLVPEGARGLPLAIGYGPRMVEAGRRDFTYDGLDRVVVADGGVPVTLRFESAGDADVLIVREYTFDPFTYSFSTTIEMVGPREPAARRELTIGWPGITPTERKEEEKALSSTMLLDGDTSRQHLGGLKKGDKKDAGEIAWVTSQSRYFMAAIAPVGGAFWEAVRVGDVETRTAGFDATTTFEGESVRQTFLVYAGPQDYAALSELGLELESAVDLGWSLTRPLSVLMLRALVAAHNVIPNYGLVIILFSVLTKLLFYRLTHKSFAAMKRMQDLQPKLKELQEKFKNDKDGLAKAQMELYKTEKANPLGGCLPMLLQMPVFVALFQVLRTTIELRGAPFALWITDLSQPDTIATIMGFPIHILPLLMGVGMLVQQRFTSKDPQQAMMGNLMPIVFTALFYNFAAGLVLYWSVNTALSIWQQYYIHKGGDEQPVAGEPAIESAETTSTTSAPEFSDAEPAPPAGAQKTGPTSGQRKKK